MVIATKSAAAHVVTPSVTISMESLKGHRYTKITPGHHAPDLSFELKPQAVVELIRGRLQATQRVHLTLQHLGKDLKDFFPKVHDVLPPRLQGRLVNPDGSPAAGVGVTLHARQNGSSSDVYARPARTDRHGGFTLKTQPVRIPDDGLILTAQAGGKSADIALRKVDLLDMKLGTFPLDIPIKFPPAVLGDNTFLDDIRDKLPASEGDVDDNPGDFTTPAPGMTMGCGESECARYFQSNSGVIDRFSFGVMVRLVEPYLGQREAVVSVNVQDGGQIVIPLPFGGSTTIDLPDIVQIVRSLGDIQLRDRIAIAEPVDVDKFRQQAEEEPALVSKAVSLGLGYVVNMRQVWIPSGFSLGDLVYSLPLAPGEEQRIAVYEQTQTLSVRDSETLSMEEQQNSRELSDSSADAVFTSALRESAHGGSRQLSGSMTGGLGEAFGLGAVIPVSGIPLVAGLGGAFGFGGSASAGQSESWQNASRDFTSSAAQEFHSSISRQASARRRSSRTAMRLASATNTEQVSTKAVANHNHSHALTMQYWEVLRHFSVNSAVDDVQLVCLVPLELIPWLPFGEPRELGTDTLTRAGLLARYALLLRYADVLRTSFSAQPALRQGLDVLAGLAGDPTMRVQSPGTAAQDVVQVRASGTFLPFEEITVTALTRSGRRIGPVKLQGSIAPLSEAYFSREQLVAELDRRRNADAGTDLTANLALPDPSMRHEITGFELRRRFVSTKYFLAVQSVLGNLGDMLATVGDLRQFNNLDLGVQLSPQEDERLFGGPFIWDVRATIGSDQFASFLPGGRGVAQRMNDLLPVPALRLPPVMSFADILKTESVLQHVVRNAVTYSRNVWASVTPEERVMMLDRFTIGVPPSAGGGSGPGSDIPLMNCVANKVLGFYGNSMIMPFAIPPELAKTLGMTSRTIQEALLRFHRQAFRPPQTSITLPTPGVLGEAVLGCCNSSEKIDLTRFWNWKDSPIDRPEDPLTKLPTNGFQGFTLGGADKVEAPSALLTSSPTTPQTLINNVTGTPAGTVPANLLEQMLTAAKSAGGPSLLTTTDLTGATALQTAIAADRTQAEKSFTDAIGKAETMAGKAFDQLGKVMEAQKAQADADKAAGAAADKKATDARNASVAQLTDPQNLTKLLGLITNAGTGQEAATAQALITELLGSGGGSALTMVEQSQVLAAVQPLLQQFTAAAPALLAALGI